MEKSHNHKNSIGAESTIAGPADRGWSRATGLALALARHFALAYRRCHATEIQYLGGGLSAPLPDRGIFGAVRRRGAEEAGAVFVKVAHLDGNAMLYGPAPQTVYDESRPADRLFAPASPQPVPEQSVEDRLAKEIRFDPDVWIVETEDRAGRHFLDLAKG